MDDDVESLFEIGTDGPRVIVVGVDGSRTSMRAGAYALGLARRQGARLVAVYVAQLGTLAGTTPMTWQAMEDAERSTAEELRCEIEEHAKTAGVGFEFLSPRGEVGHELTRIADDVRADLVVVGASEHLGHRLVGSLAVHLVRKARWPVTVVP